MLYEPFEIAAILISEEGTVGLQGSKKSSGPGKLPRIL
jgi:hypothetical protein